MGSDAYMSTFWRWCANIFYYIRWDATIVKTRQMEDMLRMSKLHVIPNGVNMERFTLMEKNKAREKIKYFSEKKLILFLADPRRSEKNFPLAKQVVDALNNPDIELMAVYNVSNELIPCYLNAADALLLTSKWEGSPNVIKEAMACNLPIVSTDVGDVKEVIGSTEGCYICSYDPKVVAEKIKMALDFGKRTNGRERIIELGLDADNIAKKIINVYDKVLERS